MTTVFSNGSGAAQPLEALFVRLAENTLDPSFEGFGNFVLTGDPAIAPAHVRFWGNFYDYSHVFCVETADPDLIARLTAAIRRNQASASYAAAREAHLARKAAEAKRQAEIERERRARRTDEALRALGWDGRY